MEAAAGRATGHKGGQGEGNAASLTNGGKPATRQFTASQAAAVGLADKFHKRPAFCKRSCSGSMTAASTLSHG